MRSEFYCPVCETYSFIQRDVPILVCCGRLMRRKTFQASFYAHVDDRLPELEAAQNIAEGCKYEPTT